MTLRTIDESAANEIRPSGLKNHPLFQLGFRPFYLLAAAFAVVSVPLWLIKYFGWINRPMQVDLSWHVHEMVFGFAIAVIVGFLYTAARNWTGLWTPRHGALAAIAALWIAGRAGMLFLDPLWAALLDASFLPVASWPLYTVIKRAGNKRNMLLIALLSILSAANIVFHIARMDLIAISPLQPLYAAILLVVVIESVIGGRVIPNFTSNAVTGAKPVVDERRDHISLAVTVIAALAWSFGFPPPLTASLAAAAAVAQATRLIGWKPLCTMRNPLLWILHISYAWIPVGFLLLSLAALGVVSPSAAFHVLAIGSMAGLIIGMITRTSLGHTGRILKAGKAEVAMYFLMQAGIISRFAAAITSGSARDTLLVAAAIAWVGAFLIFLVVYTPYLTSARIDGREG
ncbi:NnrS family protein [Noviherbaspirillum sp.]|uniref:NnrS family protein n=1 Tax=Noviherbaspirillum sp. TaxID=1926288 RepID=UPI002FE2E571